MSSLIQWTRKGTQCMFLQWQHFLQHSGWFTISLIVIYSMLNGWPWLNLGLLEDYGQKGMWDSQVNLASDWGWGRNIRITSQVIVFCVLDMNNFYRRIKKSYKLTGLCVFSPREWCWRILCTFVLFDILPRACVKTWNYIQDHERSLCSGWDVLAGSEASFCCFCLVLFLFLIGFEKYTCH